MLVATPNPRLRRGPFLPARYLVARRRHETGDVVTLWLDPVDDPVAEPRPGQFNMLSAPGVGEIAISWSGVPDAGEALRHTIRDVGPVSHALCNTDVGALVGVRGPFGDDWGLDRLEGEDVVVVAGGIGLAPLFGAISQLARRQRDGGGRCFVAVGARLPDQIPFRDAFADWRRLGAEVLVTVDVADRSWDGSVGLVTQLLPRLDFDPELAVALVCGPEVMIRFTARDLVRLGVAPESVRISLERNMQCGIGLCGHCQLGPYLLCRDGPIVAFSDQVAALLSVQER